MREPETRTKSWDEKSKDQQDSLQLTLLQDLLKDIGKTKFYSAHFRKNNVDYHDIRSLDDLRKFPLLDRNDLLENDISSFIACPKSEIESVSATGGTSGKSKLILVDKGTRAAYQEMIKRLLEMWGIQPGSTVALLAPMGLGNYGWVWMHGLSASDATCVPFGLSSDYEYVIEVMQSLKVDQIVSSPAVVMSLTKQVKEQGVSPQSYGIQNIVLAGSPLTPKVRDSLRTTWKSNIRNFFGTTESGTMAGECQVGDGFHMFTDLFIAEVLDSETNQPVEDGNVGELVITTLVSRATPLVRYRTHDMVKVSYESCDCGRLAPRMWHMGRTEDTVYLQGAHKLHGYIIESALASIEGLSTDFQLVLTKENQTDILFFRIESLADASSIDMNTVVNQIENVSNAFKQGVKEGRFVVRVEILSAGTLEKTPRGKIKDHIIDLR